METFSLEKTSCHNWKITDDQFGDLTIGTVSLYTYLDVLLDDELTFNEQGELNINLEDYDGGDDGAFYLTIRYTKPPSLLVRTAYVCIYDLCDAENCYKALFKHVLCKCNDPCDASCEELYDMKTKRQDLELIFSLYTTIEQMIYFEKYRNLGSFSMSESRKSYMSQVGRMIKKMAVVVNRCGMCSDENVEDITC